MTVGSVAAFCTRRIAAPLLLLVACTPALDWREVKADADSLTALFPCRPERRSRQVNLTGNAVRMQMASCAAGGSTYAIAFIDLRDPATVGGALEAFRDAAVANVGGAAPRVGALGVVGMTPNPQAVRLAITGRLPDGTAVQEYAAFFAKGLRVYQASVIGPAPAADAVETFISGLRFAA
jgi:hypothetical protein